MVPTIKSREKQQLIWSISFQLNFQNNNCWKYLKIGSIWWKTYILSISPQLKLKKSFCLCGKHISFFFSVKSPNITQRKISQMLWQKEQKHVIYFWQNLRLNNSVFSVLYLISVFFLHSPYWGNFSTLFLYLWVHFFNCRSNKDDHKLRHLKVNTIAQINFCQKCLLNIQNLIFSIPIFCQITHSSVHHF